VEDLFFFLLGCLCLLTFITLAGHGSWVVLSFLYRALTGKESSQPKRPRPRIEIPDELPLARDQRDLATTRQTLKEMAARGELSTAEMAPVLLQVNARLARLAGEDAPVEALDADQRLNELEPLLNKSPQLSLAERRRAVTLARLVELPQVAPLPAALQYNLAKLLESDEQIWKALAVYRSLLTSHGSHPGCVPTALEAGKLAAGRNLIDEASYFLGEVLRRDAPAETKAIAQEILGRLKPATARAAVQPNVWPDQVAKPIAPQPVREPAQPIAPPAPQPIAPILAEIAPEPAPAAPRPAALVITPKLADVTPAVPTTTESYAVQPPAMSVTPVMPATPRVVEPPRPALIIPPAITRPVVPSKPLPPPPPPEPPAPPRKPLAEVLSSFMEERNIRWGELVGGLLIVGCSIALVLSLWNTLAKIPYYQFVVFSLATAAVFGVGLYTQHRWKLAATSHGVLVIASLLVPLNFLAMALSASGHVAIRIALEMIALAGFAYLSSQAARVLTPAGKWLMPVGILGSSAAMLLIARLLPAESGTPSLALVVGLGLLPLASQGIAIGGLLWKTLDGPADAPRQSEAEGIFALLGTTCFALLLALGLLVVRSADLGLASDWIAVHGSLAAIPIAAAGLLLMDRLKNDAGLAGHRTASTAVAIAGMVAMAGATVAAWPWPWELMLVGLVNYAALSAMALRARMPMAHLLALAVLAVAYLAGFHSLWGTFTLLGPITWEQIALAEVVAKTGTSLVAFFLAVSLAGEWLSQQGRTEDAHAYSLFSGLVAVVSLALVTWSGFTEADQGVRAMAVYALYGIGALAINARMLRPQISYAGFGLLMAGSVWGLWWNQQAITGIWPAFLAAEALLLALVSVALYEWSQGAAGAALAEGESLVEEERAFGLPAAWCSTLATIVAAGLAVWFAIALLGTEIAPAWAGIMLASTALLLAWRFAEPLAVRLAALLFFVSAGYALSGPWAPWAAYPWSVAALVSATALGIPAALLAWLAPRKSEGAAGMDSESAPTVPPSMLARLDAIFSQPLAESALAASVISFPAIAVFSSYSATQLAVLFGWLAALWLAGSMARRMPDLFTAFQIALTASVVAGTQAWIEVQPWYAASGGFALSSPKAAQAFGLSLGVLALAWSLVRLGMTKADIAQDLMNPRWPAFDRILARGVVLGVLLMNGAWVLGAASHELFGGYTPASGAMYDIICGPIGWAVLALAAATEIGALFNGWRPADGVAWIAVAISAGYLLAGTFHADVAVATALRWILAIDFLFVGAVLWGRTPMRALAERCGASLEKASPRPRGAEILALATLVLPVIALTGFAMLNLMFGSKASGPADGSFFAGWQPLVNYPLPLLLLIAAMVGFAVRETSSTYAFAGGLIFCLASVAGYVMQGTLAGQAFRLNEFVIAIQIATLAAGVWALAWLGMRSWLGVWQESGESRWASSLMTMQLSLGAIGNTLLITLACLILALLHPWEATWPEAAGNGWGWAALVSVVAAWVIRTQQAGRKPRPNMVGVIGLASLGLVACTVQSFDSQWGARALMFNWAFYAVALVAGTWTVAERLREFKPEVVDELAGMAARWVRVSAMLAVLVGLKLALWHGEQLYAAAGISIAALAGAAMAAWRRREGWAFVSGWGANVAATLVVWHFLLAREIPGDVWWLYFLQANTIACGAVGLLWLAARRRMYAGTELSVEAGPLLGLQVGLAAIGCAVFVSMAGFALVVDPADAPEWLADLGHAPSWVALLLAAGTSLLYVRQIAPQRTTDVVAPSLLAAGVLLACQVLSGISAGSDTWPAYHTLMLSWGVAGVLLLAAGLLLCEKLPAWVESTSINAWVTVTALALAALALRGIEDPHGPYWSASQAVIASALVAMLAVWLRLPWHAWLAGLFVSVAASLVWWHFEAGTGGQRILFERLALTNVLALAGTSLGWTLAGFAWRRVAEAVRPTDGTPPYAHVAAVVAVVSTGLLVVAGIAGDLKLIALTPSLTLGGALGWGALVVSLLSIAILAIGHSVTYTTATLYLGGLTALALGLHQAELSPRDLGWWGTLGLAAYVLSAAAAARGAASANFWKSREPGAHWFFSLEGAISLVVFALSSWIALDRSFSPGEALAGPLAGAMVFGAALLMVFGDWAHESYLRTLRAMVLIGGVLFLSTLGWAAWPMFEPVGIDGAGRLLQALAVLLPAASLSLAVGAFGLNLWLPADSPWARSNARVTPGWGALSALSLLAILFLEFRLLNEDVAVGWATTLSVAVGILGLIAMAIGWALASGRGEEGAEGTGFSLAQRQGMVYAAEALAVVLALHVRLTRPELFGGGFFQRYGVFLLMGVAFAAAGLAELFRRRKVLVLADPFERTSLALPIVTALSYFFLAQPSPLVWFLICLFYGFLSVQRGSFALGFLAAAALNVGLWVIWHEQNLNFTEHLQLWLIPLGLSVLAAEQINHRRLSRQQASSIRYLAMSVIYASSTADMFLAGIDSEHWYLPLVLAGLSVLGILAGIVLRIRPFLFLGVSFLLLAVTTLIWHAAVGLGQTWIWYVAGIVLGAGIIALFAVFEKRRNDILAALEKFKAWE